MAQPKESPGDASKGFAGAVAGLTLPDVIQLNGQNRFSGCVAVHYGSESGNVYFRDGEIIHAEQGEKAGEEAFFEIMGWPAGKFSLQPNVTTTKSTIQKSWKFLVMEAFRLLDERRARSAGAPPPAPPTKAAAAARPAASAGNITERLRQIPGVSYAVWSTKEGGRLGDDTFEGERLAGQAAYLALMGNKLGAIFQAGDLQAASVQGQERHLLLLVGKSQYLGVAIEPGSQPGVVEAEVRKVLASITGKG